MSEVKPIRSDADLDAALLEIERLWGATFGTPDGDRLDVLATLVEAYEAAHYPMELPDAVSAIQFRLEQSGKTVKDIEPLLGGRTRTWEILHGRRRLSMRMAQRLHAELGVPLEPMIMGNKPPRPGVMKKAASLLRRPAAKSARKMTTDKRATGGRRADH